MMDAMTSKDDWEAGRQRLDEATSERVMHRWAPHNHTTRKMAGPGQCPACDQLRALSSINEETP